jgi:hypothetical protein
MNKVTPLEQRAADDCRWNKAVGVRLVVPALYALLHWNLVERYIASAYFDTDIYWHD